jgi:hypothetical protein
VLRPGGVHDELEDDAVDGVLHGRGEGHGRAHLSREWRRRGGRLSRLRARRGVAPGALTFSENSRNIRGTISEHSVNCQNTWANW